MGGTLRWIAWKIILQYCKTVRWSLSKLFKFPIQGKDNLLSWSGIE